MRELKFRVWDSTPTEQDEFTGVMINHDYVIKSDYLIDGLNGKYPIMQYTGFNDLHGIEIYEGDILENHLGRIVQVYWHIPSGQWDYKALNSLGTPTHFMDMTPMFTTIIGNIYQDPELL